MTMLNPILNIFTQFAILGGGLWAVWGVIGLAGGLSEHNGQQQQKGVWTIIGGGMVIAAAALFKTIVVQ